MINNFWTSFDNIDHLYESKEDQEKFTSWAGADLANRFYKNKDRLKGSEKDIYYWMRQKPIDLEHKLNLLSQIKTKATKNKEAKEGAELIYTDDRWNVYSINSFEAAKKYGANTKWCITGSESGWNIGKQENKYWKDYTNKGVDFYFYINKITATKYALVLYPNEKYEIFDETDNQVDNIINAPIIQGLPNITLQVEDFEIDDSDRLITCNLDAKEIKIPDNVKYIGGGNTVFTNANVIQKVIIPDSVKVIGENAFNGCISLQSINIPNRVEVIKNGAFANCIALTNIEIPDSVTKLEHSTFMGCSELKTIKLSENITSIPWDIFWNCLSLQTIIIPNGVVRIDDEAFYWCTKLKSITIPESVTSINRRAFAKCKSLTDVYYLGSEKSWNNIKIAPENDELLNSNIHFN